MEFKVDAENELIKKYLENLTGNLLKQLNLHTSNSFLTVIVDDDLGDNAAVTVTINIPDTDEVGYVVAIKPLENWIDLGTALAHELVHVRQYAKGYLIALGEGYNLWSGKVYGPETPYLDRPWEIDAFSRQEILYRRALEV